MTAAHTPPVSCVFVATTNPGKLREIHAVLAGAPVALHSLADVASVQEPEETGETFDANARLKALYYDAHGAAALAEDGRCEVITVAEDSGLEIDALHGEPGVRSARFIRPDASYAERFAEIDRRLRNLGTTQSPARFVCALAAARRGRIVFETTGVVEGVVVSPPRGAGGFGYDPIFLYPAFGQTFGEASAEAKRAVAHRGVAFRAFEDWLRTTLLKTKNGED